MRALFWCTIPQSNIDGDTDSGSGKTLPSIWVTLTDELVKLDKEVLEANFCSKKIVTKSKTGTIKAPKEEKIGIMLVKRTRTWVLPLVASVWSIKRCERLY